MKASFVLATALTFVSVASAQEPAAIAIMPAPQGEADAPLRPECTPQPECELVVSPWKPGIPGSIQNGIVAMDAAAAPSASGPSDIGSQLNLDTFSLPSSAGVMGSGAQ